MAQGANIVITGRSVDSAVTLGPCIHEFGWKSSDFDRLAAGSLAGHIIECGAQATGGLFTDWKLAGDWANIGYPVVEVNEDGSFVVTKPEKTGGIVCSAAVAEQLVYEIGDPRSYILPDVVCDFADVTIVQEGPDRVKVSGAKGRMPTDKLKVSATYFDGFRLVCSVTIRGIDAAEKAEKTFDAVLRRVRAMLNDGVLPILPKRVSRFSALNQGMARTPVSLRLEKLWDGWQQSILFKRLGVLLRELTSAGTSMSPGTTRGRRDSSETLSRGSIILASHRQEFGEGDRSLQGSHY